MSAKTRTKYRNVEHIAKKVNEVGSFPEYIKTIAPSTARNYQKFLVEYVNSYENRNQRFLKLIKESLVLKVNYDLKKQIESILIRIKENAYDSNKINIIEDLEFLMFIILINEKNKDKQNLKYKDITYLEKNNTLQISIRKEQKYVVVSENSLFKKALDSIKAEKEQKMFQSRSFIKLIENQFLYSEFSFSKDLKSFRDLVKVHYIKQSI